MAMIPLKNAEVTGKNSKDRKFDAASLFTFKLSKADAVTLATQFPSTVDEVRPARLENGLTRYQILRLGYRLAARTGGAGSNALIAIKGGDAGGYTGDFYTAECGGTTAGAVLDKVAATFSTNAANLVIPKYFHVDTTENIKKDTDRFATAQFTTPVNGFNDLTLLGPGWYISTKPEWYSEAVLILPSKVETNIPSTTRFNPPLNNINSLYIAPTKGLTNSPFTVTHRTCEDQSGVAEFKLGRVTSLLETFAEIGLTFLGRVLYDRSNAIVENVFTTDPSYLEAAVADPTVAFNADTTLSVSKNYLCVRQRYSQPDFEAHRETQSDTFVIFENKQVSVNPFTKKLFEIAKDGSTNTGVGDEQGAETRYFIGGVLNHDTVITADDTAPNRLLRERKSKCYPYKFDAGERDPRNALVRAANGDFV